MSRTAILVVAAAISSLAACSEVLDTIDSSGDRCTPGQTFSCLCPDSSLGAQECLPSGQARSACVCDAPAATDGASDLPMSVDDGPFETGDDGFDDADDTTAAAPEPLPAPDVELRDARIHVLVVGGALSASLMADWAATGRDDVTVDVEVLSSTTYRSWTALATGLPPVYFTDIAFPVTQGERRFDVRVVARDASGGAWTSNTITIQ